MDTNFASTELQLLTNIVNSYRGDQGCPINKYDSQQISKLCVCMYVYVCVHVCMCAKIVFANF